MALLRRIAPGLLLLVLAPLVAEYLLGDFSVRRLPLLLAFLPEYGGGALLIREVVRRSGRGWPSMLLLAGAYSLVEEGFTTESLFNPNYAGQHLLSYGYVPALGTSLNWCLFVLTLHVVWSISTPILIAEGLAAERRAMPWLHRPGLVITAVLFVFGCLATALFTFVSMPFVASIGQLLVTAVLIAALIATAFALPKQGVWSAQTRSKAPSPWVVVAAALFVTSAFMLIVQGGRSPVPAIWPLLGSLACEIAGFALIAFWSRRPGWGAKHYLALSAGTVLTYAWGSLRTFAGSRTNLGYPTDALDVAGQVLLVLVILALIAWGVLRPRPRRR